MDFKIGCDPEFGFTDEHGNLRSAAELVTAPSGGSENEGIGLDGCSSIAEMRPKPSYDPAQVVRNLRQCFIKGLDKNPELWDYSWRAGSLVGRNPTGGHIHIGISEVTMTNSGMNPASLVAHMNSFLGVPLSILEGKDGATRRNSANSYGRLSDSRTADHGGIEYRTLGSWLTSPYVAYGVLALAKTITWDNLQHRDEEHMSLMYGNDVEHAFYNKDLSVLRSHAEKAYLNIKKMEKYGPYKAPIDFLFRLIAEKKTWFPKGGMRAAWGIPRMEYPPKDPMPTINLKTIWEAALQ